MTDDMAKLMMQMILDNFKSERALLTLGQALTEYCESLATRIDLLQADALRQKDAIRKLTERVMLLELPPVTEN